MRRTAVALVLGLAALVAVASQGTPIWMPLRVGRADRPEILANLAVLWGLGIAAGLAVTVLLHRTVIARRPGAPPLPTMLQRALPIATVALVALSLLTIARTDLEGGPGSSDGSVRTIESSGRRGSVLGVINWWSSPVRAGQGGSDRDLTDAAAPDPGARIPLLLIALGALAAAAAGAIAWWYARRSAAPEDLADEEDGPAGPDPEAVRGVVISTIDAMLADPDPNTAIIGAYARLLEDLAACGAARRRAEAPMEHLRRVLMIRRVRPEPLRRLIALFEVARFSTHPLDSSHRERALEALRAVAADLAAPAHSRVEAHR